MWATSPSHQHRTSPVGMAEEWRGPRPGPSPRQHRFESYPAGYNSYSSGPVDHHYPERSRTFPPLVPGSPHLPYMPSYASSYPTQAPIQSVQARPMPGQTYFHPYHPKAKPLLFVNTVPPTGPSPHTFSSDALSQLKPKRKRITPEQLTELTALFEKTDSPSFDVREKLGNKVGMTNREVQVWMQNRRAKMNRIKAQAAGTDEVNVESKDKVTSPATDSISSPVASASPPSPPSASQMSSFRIPNPRRPSPPRSTAGGEEVPSQVGPHRRGFQGQNIEIPQRSGFVSHHVQSYRSPPMPSSYSASPSLQSPYSATFSTPSLSSPGFSSSGSYFSPNSEAYTPSISSPSSSTFFRLSLDSPSLLSPRSEAGYFSDQCGDRASSVPTEGERFIRLPPIVTPGAWDHGTRGHKRAASEGGPVNISTKLPSLQGLVQSIESSRSASGDSAPSSPEDGRESHVPPPPASAGPAANAVFRMPHRRTHHARPSSLSNILPRTTEEEVPESTPAQKGFGHALGLGMLEAAATEIAANELKSLEEEEKLRLLAQARRMSVDVAVPR